MKLHGTSPWHPNLVLFVPLSGKREPPRGKPVASGQRVFCFCDSCAFLWLGIEFFDEVGVAVVDDFAFYFEGWGEFATVYGEFIRQKRNTADPFIIS